MPRTSRQSSTDNYVHQLHHDIETTTRKLELERRRLGKLFEDFNRARAEFDEKVLPSKKQKTEQDIYRDKAMANDISPGSSGYNNRVEEILKSCSPGAMRSLESRISKSIAKLNTFNDTIREMRQSIDALRMEKTKSIVAGLSEANASLEEDKRITKTTRLKLAELSSVKDTERRSFREQAQDIKKDIADRSQESHEWELQNSRDILKSRMGAKAGGHSDGVRFASSTAREMMLTGYTCASEEETFSEMDTMKRILKLAFLNSIQRRHIRQHKRNSEVFDEAFRTIKQATGITNVTEIVRIFIKLEEQNFGLATYSNTLSQDIEAWEKENGRLNQALDMHRAKVAADGEKRHRLILAYNHNAWECKRSSQALLELNREIDKNKEGIKNNVEAINHLCSTVIEKALAAARRAAECLHKEKRSNIDPRVLEASRQPWSPRKRGTTTSDPQMFGIGDLLLKYLDCIERSLSMWADVIPNTGMPPDERPFNYMMAVPLSARSHATSVRSRIIKEGAPLVRAVELPVARLEGTTAQQPTIARRRKSGSTVNSDDSSSEDDVANFDRPCSLTDLRKRVMSSLERKRELCRGPSHRYDEFVAPMSSLDGSFSHEASGPRKSRPFMIEEREELTPEEIEKIFLS
ncbi:coiledcoil domain containing, partial [Perkinsus chesapeaki]